MVLPLAIVATYIVSIFFNQHSGEEVILYRSTNASWAQVPLPLEASHGRYDDDGWRSIPVVIL